MHATRNIVVQQIDNRSRSKLNRTEHLRVVAYATEWIVLKYLSFLQSVVCHLRSYCAVAFKCVALWFAQLNIINYYLAIQRSVWRDIKFFFCFFFVCLYGWGYLKAGWCDRREILAQGRANTRDGNEVVRGWSAHGGPWGGGLNIFWGEGTHFRE